MDVTERTKILRRGTESLHTLLACDNGSSEGWGDDDASLRTLRDLLGLLVRLEMLVGIHEESSEDIEGGILALVMSHDDALLRTAEEQLLADSPYRASALTLADRQHQEAIRALRGLLRRYIQGGLYPHGAAGVE